MNLLKCLLLLTLTTSALSGCSNTKYRVSNHSSPALKVGMAAHYRPLVWQDQGEVVGLEVDFAHQLAEDLKRELVITTYNWDALFAALQSGEIDLIMSGVSITKQRRKQFVFSSPYLRIGQMAIIRLKDAGKLSTYGALHSGQFRVGYSLGTTGEAYVLNELKVPSQGFTTTEEGLQALRNEQIDFFIHDAPTAWNLANEPVQRSQLLGLYRPLTEEYLGWVMRSNDVVLKNQIDEVLQRWDQSGVKQTLVKKWIPVTILSTSN